MGTRVNIHVRRNEHGDITPVPLGITDDQCSPLSSIGAGGS